MILVGLLVLGIVIFGFLIVRDQVLRWDLTEDNRFTISEASYRLADDLGLGEDAVIQSLMFADAKIGDTMDIAMRPQDAEAWLAESEQIREYLESYGDRLPDAEGGVDVLRGHVRSEHEQIRFVGIAHLANLARHHLQPGVAAQEPATHLLQAAQRA